MFSAGLVNSSCFNLERQLANFSAELCHFI